MVYRSCPGCGRRRASWLGCGHCGWSWPLCSCGLPLGRHGCARSSCGPAAQLAFAGLAPVGSVQLAFAPEKGE